MNEIEINSFSELDEFIDETRQGTLFRGVSDTNFDLLPSLFRCDGSDEPSTNEINLMWLFKTSAKGILRKNPETDIEWLVLAQHHGLPTRLLDWSLSPLTACYFAVKSQSDSNGAIYIYERSGFSKEENIKLDKLDKIKAFIPTHTSPRVTAQSGLFTVHPDNEQMLDDKEIIKLIIPADRKKSLYKKLVKFGIHHATMFPDLDGLSKHVRNLQGYGD